MLQAFFCFNYVLSVSSVSLRNAPFVLYIVVSIRQDRFMLQLFFLVLLCFVGFVGFIT